MKGKEVKSSPERDRGLELVVQTLLKSQDGVEVLKFFIRDGLGASFTTDPLMNSYLEGRRLYGRKMLQILTTKFKQHVAEVLGDETTN